MGGGGGQGVGPWPHPRACASASCFSLTSFPSKETSSKAQAGESASQLVLGEALPVVPARLVRKILKGEFVDMAELLKDNGGREGQVRSWGRGQRRGQ